MPLNLKEKLVSSLYNAGISAYRAGVSVVSHYNDKAAKLRHGQARIWEQLQQQIIPGEKYFWIHTSSLGEFEQGRPLIERIKTAMPQVHILLTFFSPSGYEVRKDYPCADVVSYLPFDLPRQVERFLDIVNPFAAVFIKYEFWRNYLLALKRRNIPTYLVSGIFRPSQLFFKPGGGWYRRLLDCFDTFYVQNRASLLLLESIGHTNVVVAGDTRFDRVSQISANHTRIELLERFKAKDMLLFMAGSSWPADENIYLPWLMEHTEVRGVIAPHEFDPARLHHLLTRLNGQGVLWSDALENPTLLDNHRILVMNCFGLLSSAYAYADMAYIGGGFGVGLHNINEAAVYRIPVIFGPNNSKFIEAKEIQEAGGGFEVDSSATLAAQADRLLLDTRYRQATGSAAARYINSKLGATDTVYSGLKPLIKKYAQKRTK